jgi:hypothetical protein
MGRRARPFWYPERVCRPIDPRGWARPASDRYETFDDLAAYCYEVASTVGLMSKHIIGFAGERAIPYAVELGIALQLTNILRDVGEDWRGGRLYLPLHELANFGLSEASVAVAWVYEAWRDYLELRRVDPTCCIHFDDGARLALTGDLDVLRPRLEAFERGSLGALHRYLHEG